MKTTIHTLVIDDHSSGVEVSVYASEKALHEVLKSTMEARLNDAEEWATNSDEECVEEVRQLIAEGKIADAWESFNDGELKAPEDDYYVEAHEIEIPA